MKLFQYNRFRRLRRRKSSPVTTDPDFTLYKMGSAIGKTHPPSAFRTLTKQCSKKSFPLAPPPSSALNGADSKDSEVQSANLREEPRLVEFQPERHLGRKLRDDKTARSLTTLAHDDELLVLCNKPFMTRRKFSLV